MVSLNGLLILLSTFYILKGASQFFMAWFIPKKYKLAIENGSFDKSFLDFLIECGVGLHSFYYKSRAKLLKCQISMKSYRRSCRIKGVVEILVGLVFVFIVIFFSKSEFAPYFDYKW